MASTALQTLKRDSAPVLVPLALMWLVFLVDKAIFQGALTAHGIEVRHTDGLKGVLTAPFLHADLGHISANSLPFAVLGFALLYVCGKRMYWSSLIGISLFAGLATWAFARPGIHVGASILVFGLFGAICGAALWIRAGRAILAALVAVPLYGGAMLAGMVPGDRFVSWEGHLFGFLSGAIIVSLLGTKPKRPSRR